MVAGVRSSRSASAGSRAAQKQGNKNKLVNNRGGVSRRRREERLHQSEGAPPPEQTVVLPLPKLKRHTPPPPPSSDEALHLNRHQFNRREEYNVERELEIDRPLEKLHQKNEDEHFLSFSPHDGNEPGGNEYASPPQKIENFGNSKEVFLSFSPPGGNEYASLPPPQEEASIIPIVLDEEEEALTAVGPSQYAAALKRSLLAKALRHNATLVKYVFLTLFRDVFNRFQ